MYQLSTILYNIDFKQLEDAARLFAPNRVLKFAREDQGSKLGKFDFASWRDRRWHQLELKAKSSS